VRDATVLTERSGDPVVAMYYFMTLSKTGAS